MRRVPYLRPASEVGARSVPERVAIRSDERGRFTVEAGYSGAGSAHRAQHDRTRLAAAGLAATGHTGPSGEIVLLIGPLAHRSLWRALEALLGAPVELPPVA